MIDKIKELLHPVMECPNCQATGVGKTGTTCYVCRGWGWTKGGKANPPMTLEEWEAKTTDGNRQRNPWESSRANQTV